MRSTPAAHVPSPLKSIHASRRPTAEAVMAVETQQQHAYYFDLPMMILNLSTADERPTFVKLEIAL